MPFPRNSSEANERGQDFSFDTIRRGGSRFEKQVLPDSEEILLGLWGDNERWHQLFC